MFARPCHPIVMSFMLLSPNNMSRLIVDQLSAGSSQMHAHHQHMKSIQSLYTNQPSAGLSQENSMSCLASVYILVSYLFRYVARSSDTLAVHMLLCFIESNEAKL